jgi:hypothetical protein
MPPGVGIQTFTGATSQCCEAQWHAMNIVILDDYQDAVRKLRCAAKLDAYAAKVYTNTVKGIGQLSVRLRDADVIVLIRERSQISRQLIEKLPKLKLISQTGRVGWPHRRHSLHRARHGGGRGHRLAAGAGRAHLGADHGGHAAAAAVHQQPQARRLAAVGPQVGLDAAQLRARHRCSRARRSASGATAASASWWRATGRPSACRW